MPGHELGHLPSSPDWARLVEHFRDTFGGWAALVDALVRRAPGVVPADPATVEKGLRRLARRGQKSGGQYGRWVLRYLGAPPSVEQWARELGQYHSRLSDLPTSQRAEQLRLWDRPPIAESRLSAWIDVGLASVHLRRRERELCDERLQHALRKAPSVGPEAESEALLLAARRATDTGDREQAQGQFDRVEELLDTMERGPRLCYRARLVGQRAFHLTRPPPGGEEQPAAALALFESIEAPPDLPFVAYRRTSGLAWCRWRMGERDEGIRLARQAAEWAADGGLVRFRVMALNMLGAMLVEADDPEANATWERAARLASMLEDPDLARRVEGAERRARRARAREGAAVRSNSSSRGEE